MPWLKHTNFDAALSPNVTVRKPPKSTSGVHAGKANASPRPKPKHGWLMDACSVAFKTPKKSSGSRKSHGGGRRGGHGGGSRKQTKAPAFGSRRSKPLPPGSERCACGGITGEAGTPDGARKWRAHIGTKRHMLWEVSPAHQNAKVGAQGASSQPLATSHGQGVAAVGTATDTGAAVAATRAEAA